MYYLVTAYKPGHADHLLTERIPSVHDTKRSRKRQPYMIAERWASLMEANGFVVKDVEKVMERKRGKK